MEVFEPTKFLSTPIWKNKFTIKNLKFKNIEIIIY